MKTIEKKRKMGAAGRHIEGFTLLEIMIAIAISMIIMLGVMYVYWDQTKMIRRETLMLDLQQKTRFIQDKLARDLRNVGLYGKDDNLNNGKFGIKAIALDPYGNSEFQYTADIHQCDATQAGVLADNEKFKFSLYKSSLSPPSSALDPNEGKTDLGKTIGAGYNKMMVQGVEGMNFAYAYDIDKDGRLDRHNEGVIWAIDTDGDGKLDSVVDSDFDGDVDFSDSVKLLESLGLTTDIGLTNVRSMKVWLLVRGRLPRKDLPKNLTGGSSKTYYVGARPMTTGVDLDPYYMRHLTTFTVDLRNMGL